MISYSKSKNILKRSLIKLGEEFINTNRCLNRVTSKNIYVDSYYPSGNNAAFDGYALKSSDTNRLNKKIYQITNHEVINIGEELITSLYKPLSGQILLDGNLLDSYSSSQAIQLIAYVPQEVFL